ncbi:MAG: hypothetical protein ABIG61_10085, partial [Planctomycetota bacterium]
MIFSPKGISNGQVVVEFYGRRYRNRDETVFVKLGFFNVNGSFAASVMMELKSHGLFYSESTSGNKENSDIFSQIFEVIPWFFTDSSADRLDYLIGLFRREDKWCKRILRYRRDVSQWIFRIVIHSY